MTMMPSDLYLWIIRRDGWTTYLEVCQCVEFEAVESSHLGWCWRELIAERKIGVLLDKGVPVVNSLGIVYTVPRERSARYSVMWLRVQTGVRSRKQDTILPA